MMWAWGFLQEVVGTKSSPKSADQVARNHEVISDCAIIN